MIIINWPQTDKTYALQIVTIGSGVLLKTIYFNHAKSCDKKIWKFIDNLSNNTGHGYDIYINPDTLYSYELLRQDIINNKSYVSPDIKQLSVVRYYNLKKSPSELKKLIKKCHETCRLIIYKNIENTFKSTESILYRWPTFSVIDSTMQISSELLIYLKANVSYRTVMSSNNEDLYLEMTNCRVEICSIIRYDDISDKQDVPINVMLNNRKLSVIMRDCTIPNLFNIYDLTSLKKFNDRFPPYALKIGLV
jgi:hypothetical protein